MIAVDDKGIRSNVALLAEGWERRHLAEPARVEEAMDVYAEAGFEVRAEDLGPADFGTGCSACSASICSSFKLIYTRKRSSE
ncbi:MAG TPA: hypothetical protein QGF58_12770 [Myxococcota bacterium]|nr:hypothetical protein [Myxococcota bacterium]